MPNKVYPFDLDADDATELAKRIGSGDGFAVIGPSDIPSFIPYSFLKKVDSAVQIISGNVIMFNFRRVDYNCVDQHPFGAVIASGNRAISSSFLDHGDWENRTSPISEGFLNHISASGIGGYFLKNPPDGRQSGTLSDLPKGDLDAFNQFLSSAIYRTD